MEDLAAAMEDLQRRKLDQLVDAAEFRRNGGCFAQRLLRDQDGRLTRHAWGVAVTIGVAVDAAQRSPQVDQRLIKTLGGHGFVWAGHLERPAHTRFNWVGAN